MATLHGNNLWNKRLKYIINYKKVYGISITIL